MRLDRVTAEIRPRSDWEAVDLGLALVRRDFWRVFAVWWLAVLVPTVVAGWWLWESPMIWLMMFWWWKPAGSRMVLFELSRRLFGERPSWRDSWRQIPRVWTRRFWYRFLWARLSPWLPVTLAVEDLEGLRGKAYKQRCTQVTRRGEGVTIWIYFISDLAACWFGLAIVLIVWMLVPEGQDTAWRMAIESWDPNDSTSLSLLILRTVVVCVMLAISLTDVFVVGAGFGVYLNNRTWIEGWDVELAFKRLAQRLARTAVWVMALWVCGMPAVARAADQRDPAQVIREVKADDAFKVHKVIEKIPNPSKHSSSWRWPDWLKPGNAPAWLGDSLVAAAMALMAAAILWVLWKNRHVLIGRGSGDGLARGPAAARVVMGMEVSPETLPADVPGAAWALWRQGHHQQALGLLYRGAISRVIELASVEIQESDTEGDCLRRVDQAGSAAHPDYFRGITGTWSGLAYAGRCPEDREVESLCRQWPFVDRRDA
jgi:hypothetical protein